MNGRRMLAAVSALSVMFLFSGCLETKTEYWFNSDGSGKVVFDLGISKQLAGAEKMEALVKDAQEKARRREKSSNVKSVSVRSYLDGDFSHFVVEMEIRDMSKSWEDSSSNAVSNGDQMEKTLFIDGLSVRKLESGNISFERRFPGGEGEGNPTPPAMESFFAGRNATVVVHAPGIVSANGALSDDGRTVTWKIPMLDVIKGKVTHPLKAELSLDEGWSFVFVIVAIAGIVIIPLLIILILLRMLGGRGRVVLR